MMARSPALSICLQCHNDFYGYWHGVGILSSRFTSEVTPAPKEKKKQRTMVTFSVFSTKI